MGLFDKFKKNETEPALQQETEVKAAEPDKSTDRAIPTVKVDLTSQEAVDKRLIELYNMDSLYIILTNGIADFERGLSIPMVLMPKEEQKVILIFSDYEKAKKYVTVKRPMMVDGVLPIGEIKKSDNLNNIDVICANAMALGITAIDFDIDDENGFGCKLPYFMQLNKMSGQGQIIFSKEEMEKIKENNGKFTPRFNAMHIVDFTNPYSLSKERAGEVMEKILADGGIEWAVDNAAVHELCYAANQLMFKTVQEEKESTQEADKYKSVVNEINELIFNKLAGLDKWYTLTDKETGEIYTKNGAVYLIYTPRYANRMPQGTVQKAFPPTVAELAYLVGDKPVNMVVVTDGPKIMHLIDRSVFGF